MSEQHGAGTIKGWMQDLVALARSGVEFDISAGAEPHRSYAYLEYHLPDGDHSILLFRVEEDEEGRLKTYRFHGDAAEVRDRVDDLTHGEP